MKTTIDKAGRVVIPAALRARAGFTPDIELDVEADDTSVRLVRRVSPPQLVRDGKLLVVRPTVPLRDRRTIDVAALIAEERDRAK